MVALKTLIIGIQDLNAVPYGATLRVKQHAATIPNAIYFNAGNPRSWHSRNLFGKILQLIRFARPWRDPFAGYHYSNVKANELESLLLRERFQRIILTEIWTYRYLSIVLRYGRNAEVVVDLHNVESHLQDSLPRTVFNKWRSIVMRFMEQRFILKSDALWCCSEVDRQLFESLYGRNGFVVPNVVNVQDFGFLTNARTIGYVGCFNYPPNNEAALRLLYEIQPRIGGAVLYLVGKNPSPQLKTWGREGSIIVTGEVPNVKPYFDVIRTMVLPITSGSGTRFKVLEAFANGVPVVATAKAVEGLAVEDGVHFLHGETSDELIACVNRLWNDEELEDTIRMNAYRLVKAKYSVESLRA